MRCVYCDYLPSETVQAQIARLAGYCYSQFDALKENVQEEGLRVIASGDTYFTRWYIATGDITGNVPGEKSITFPSKVCCSSWNRPGELCCLEALILRRCKRKRYHAGLECWHLQELDAPEATLHVFLRGVMWRNPEVETVRVWQKLSQSWGVPLAPVSDSSESSLAPEASIPAAESSLVAHSGISDMANELYAQLRPLLVNHSGALAVRAWQLRDSHSCMRHLLRSAHASI
jgi:hypothetical protein